MSFRHLLIFSLVLAFGIVHGANILYLNVVASPSHHIWNSALANGLAARGHNVTMLSPYRNNKPERGIHYLLLEGIHSDAYQRDLNGIFNNSIKLDPLTQTCHSNVLCYNMCLDAVETNGFRTLMEYSDSFHFDVIINDFTAGACLLGFVHKFKNPPLISVTAYNNPSFLNTVIGGHQYYSYIPHNYLDYEDDMNILQRIYNFIIHIIEQICRSQNLNQKLDKLLRTKFGDGLPSVTELEQRTSLAFINTNPAFDHMAPLPENVIPVGGLQIKDSKPLPKDLEDFVSSAKEGVILFSLGSNIQSSAMNVDEQKRILDAFEQFPDHHFLWKFEKPSINLKLPKNVLIRCWFPQADILSHQKIRAFITHSGLLSTHEAIWWGVPMLGMPFGREQYRNTLQSVRKGFAEKIDFHSMTTEILKEKLQKLLLDPKYSVNAKIISGRFRDQKEKPLDRAIWWVEWLIRNPDSEYLKSPVLRLGFIVGNSIDVIAIISIVSFVLITFIARTCFAATFFVNTQNLEQVYKKSQ